MENWTWKIEIMVKIFSGFSEKRVECLRRSLSFFFCSSPSLRSVYSSRVVNFHHRENVEGGKENVMFVFISLSGMLWTSTLRRINIEQSWVSTFFVELWRLTRRRRRVFKVNFRELSLCLIGGRTADDVVHAGCGEKMMRERMENWKLFKDTSLENLRGDLRSDVGPEWKTQFFFSFLIYFFRIFHWRGYNFSFSMLSSSCCCFCRKSDKANKFVSFRKHFFSLMWERFKATSTLFKHSKHVPTPNYSIILVRFSVLLKVRLP